MFVSLKPAELILLRGEPSYLAVQGAKQLLWVSNTESDVFRMGLNGRRLLPRRGPLVLGAGLHRAVDVRHADAAGRLQADPARAQRSRVLASVPGTTQAAEAVLLAQIPQTARVSKTVQAPEVAYQGGTPQFQPIETDDACSARSTPTRTSSRSATSITCASRASGSCRRRRRARGR